MLTGPKAIVSRARYKSQTPAFAKPVTINNLSVYDSYTDPHEDPCYNESDILETDDLSNATSNKPSILKLFV
ncbi:12538_t:CDS:2 [Racocetra fulgida]|uniref:12538_t:CDS:1 n=1 Tax=Racocetra fulgida TaxID=60492 RepID=A0A9N8ZY45_9GLOM|nr:12538_t:CDS:2 [Racocetra fulgida]